MGIGEVGTRDDLMERDYGAAEGLGFDEIEALYPEGVHAEGQETREQVAQRVGAALVDLADRHPGESLIVVSHGGAIRSVLQLADPGTHHPRITNASVHSFRVTDGTLELIAFDDPIEQESLLPSCEDLDVQNAVEAQDDDDTLVGAGA